MASSKSDSSLSLLNSNISTPSDFAIFINSLLTESKDERSKLIEELTQRLERLRPEKMMEREASVAENLNKSLQYRAFPRQFYVI